MGREDVAVCHWQGDVAEVRLHLDSQELTLRGDIRAAIARPQMKAVTLCDEGVCVATDTGDLIMEMAALEAVRWQKALLKTPPTLAQKLDVSPDTPAFVLGVVDDPVVREALDGAVVPDVSASTILLAIVLDQAGLETASDMAMAEPDKHIWMLYRKGKAAVINGTAVRSHMRGLGFIDSKSSAVSDQLTATRYRLRAG